MRQYLQDVVGNEALRARLGAELEQGVFSHAYILEGPEGCGKHKLARGIIMSLACERRLDPGVPLPCGDCPTCRKIRSENCPDILRVARPDGRATLGVDAVRNLRDSVNVMPNDLDFKVYVIEDAHTMTEQAQNALLLTLEEPPAFVLFLLLANGADALLETIRSRAPVLRMQPVGEAEMSAFLLSGKEGAITRAASLLKAQSPAEYAALLRMANGRIGRAIELLEEKKRAPVMARREAAAELCRLLATGKRQDALLPHLLSFGSSRDELTARLLSVSEALRDLIALERTEDAPLIFFTDRESAIDLSARFVCKDLFTFVEATQEALAALAVNANTRLVISQYLCRLTA